MGTVFEQVIPPKRGLAVTVKKGQHLRVTDLEGKQVVDMAIFNRENPREKLSTSYSRTRYVPKPGAEYVPRDALTEGDTLMSTICRPMLTIEGDPGAHGRPRPAHPHVQSLPLRVVRARSARRLS